MTPAARIADFALEVRDACLPDEVAAAARRSILDVLSVTLAGTRTRTASTARAALLTGAGGGSAAVLGTGQRAQASTAALLNGIAAHALDFDDVWADDDGVVAWRGHPSVCILPAVLAAAETSGASGLSVLRAYVAGVEIAGKLGTAFGPALGRAGWHPTVVLGTVAAAAAAGLVLGLDRDRIQVALGLAATEASGLHRNFGTDTKPFHAGHAARCGVDAALLAGSGFTANPAALEDYLRVFGAESTTAEIVLAELGRRYDLVTPGLSVKKYPCCRFAHLPLDALFALPSPAAAEPATVTAITVRIQPGADDALVCPEARTGLEGKFSLPYLVAAGLLDGAVSLSSFTDAAVSRPEVRRLMGIVKTEYSPESGAEVEVRAGGQTWRERALIVRGDPANPLSPEEELEKCRSCLEGVLPPGSAELVSAAVADLPALAAAANLTELLEPQRG